MIFKMLLVIYLLLCALSIKELFSTKDLQKSFNENCKSNQDKAVYCLMFLIFGFVQTATVITFYSLSYKLSPLIGWLSVVQIVWALIGYLLGFAALGEMIQGNYKRKKLIYRLINVAFDVLYGALVVIALL